MNSRIGILTLALVFACAATPHAEEGQEKGSMADPAMDAMMQKFVEYGTPGENHKALDSIIGKWNATTKHWMSADSEPEVSEGMSNNEWIMDGRFIQQSYTGEVMGSEFKGLGIIGYDNLAKEYTSVWLDSMGTGMMKGTGKFDVASKSFTDSGSFSCPLTDSSRDYRSVTTIIDDNHYKYESYMKDENGAEFRSMLVTYTRQPSEEVAGAQEPIQD